MHDLNTDQGKQVEFCKWSQQLV